MVIDLDKCPICNSTLYIMGTSEVTELDPVDTSIIVHKTLIDQTCHCQSNPDNEFSGCPNFNQKVNTIVHEKRISLNQDKVKAFAEAVVLAYTVDEAMILATRLSELVGGDPPA